ncbi:hypothetical protein A33M_2696 [Rhodovulum sp. PH10]|nr:hypothetical protein A33M_2696 [Rhodovulum sp. PH10]
MSYATFNQLSDMSTTLDGISDSIGELTSTVADIYAQVGATTSAS